MRVLAWNVNHRIREKAIPDDLAELFCSLHADVVLLNEFVDGPTRAPFRDSLRNLGYHHQLVSFTPARHNQVFAAARLPFSHGDLAPPAFDGSAVSNFLHLRFDDVEVELVGLRAPWYKTAADRRAYWEQLLAIMKQASARPILFAGDINRDLFAKGRPEHRSGAPFPEADSYRAPNPTGDWSYMNHDGSSTSRIDHVLHSGSVGVEDPTYVTEHHPWVLAGPRSVHPISDHAALTFTVCR